MYDKKREQYVYTEDVWLNLLKEQQNGFRNERLKQLIQSVCKHMGKSNEHHYNHKKNRNFNKFGSSSSKSTSKVTSRSGSRSGSSSVYKESTSFRSVKKDAIDIRGLLNRITDMTYDTIETRVLSIFENIIRDKSVIHDELMKIKKQKELFDRVVVEGSNNTLYIHLYARLIYKLFQYDETNIDLFIDTIETLKTNINQVKSIENITDYDVLCEINKENDMIKGFCILCLNLFSKVDLIEQSIHIKNCIYQYIVYLFDMLRICIDNQNIDKMNSICGFIHKMFLMEYSDMASFIQYDVDKDGIIVNQLEYCVNKSEDYVRCNMKLNDVFVIFHNT